MVALPFQWIAKEATSSQPTTKEEEEGEDKNMVEVTDSEDEFAIFNQPLSPKSQVGDPCYLSRVQVDNSSEDISISKEIGIQRKQRSSL